MCSDSKTRLSPTNLKMETGFEDDKRGFSHKNGSKLLELAAMDDLAGFIHEIEGNSCDINDVSFWYGRSFGSRKKMGFEERTPIMIAALYGSTDVLEYIIGTHKVDINRACRSDGATALHCAAAGGSWSSIEVVELLIDASADIDAVDVNGKKPSDLIASSVKFSSNSRKKTIEVLLNGIGLESVYHDDEDENEGGRIKKEYPVDVSLPDINKGVYGTDEFRMFTFKVKPCSRAYSHDWTECPFVHPGENARRRDPRKYHYTCVPCPEFKKGSCAKGDNCEYAHGVFESWLHPAQYRTRICKDEMSCARKVCFFAHKSEELRPLYASTGSGMPSPKSGSVNNSLDTTSLSPFSLTSPSLVMPNTSTPPMSPSVTCSSPMGGANMWQNKVNLTAPPALQLPGSRLKTAFSARNIDLDLELQQRRHLVDEMASLSLSSSYGRIGDLNPTNLDDVFGFLDPNLRSRSPTDRFQIQQNMNHLRASYPLNVSSSPSRKASAAYGFDSSAAVATAVMNSRSSAFVKRSQSFIDRGNVVGHRHGLLGPTVNSVNPVPSKLSEWGSPNGKLEWGFSGEDVNKLRKSTSFGYRSGGGGVDGSRDVVPCGVGEPDTPWVNSLVKDVPVGGAAGLYRAERQGIVCETMPHWFDQMYIEQEQIVA
ncbi:hypothetical protein OROGR_015942 [Orobanche gracilis]